MSALIKLSNSQLAILLDLLIWNRQIFFECHINY